MQLAIQTPVQHTSFERLAALWSIADTSGFRAAFTFDHLVALGPGARPGNIGEVPPGSQFEGWITLTALAARTTNLQVGTLVTSVTHRPPAVLAKMAVTLDVVTGGRAILGVGAGWHQVEHDMYGLTFPPVGRRMTLLEESLQAFRLLCGPADTVDFDGVEVHLAGAPFEPGPVRPTGIPVLVGGSGDRLRGIVARHADIYNGFWSPGAWPEINRDLDDRMRAVGRDPADLTRTVFVHAEPSTDPRRQEAFVQELVQSRGGDAAHVRATSLVGDPDDMVAVLEAYRAAGVDMAVLNLGPTVQPDELGELAERLVPALAR